MIDMVIPEFQQNYTCITKGFLAYLLGDSTVVDVTLHPGEMNKPQSEVIVKALNGSQSEFLKGLKTILKQDVHLEALQEELYSKQSDALAKPSYYLSLQNQDDNSIISLGEEFFKPLEGLTEESFRANVLAVDSVVSVLAKFKTISTYSMKMEELEQVLANIDDAALPVANTATTLNSEMEEQEEMIEKQFDLFGSESLVSSQRHKEYSENKEQELNIEDLDFETFKELEEQDEVEESAVVEEVNTIELLNGAVVELYKKANNENRPLIKQLRADLFELEVALDLEEDVYEQIVQFKRQLLSLNFDTVEELQLQVKMTKYSLDLLLSTN